MALTKTQSLHLIQRVRDITTDKLADAKELCTTPGKELTDKERAELLRNGKIKWIGKALADGVSERDEIRDVFDFSEFEYEEKTDTKRLEKIRAEIGKAANKIRDQIILGSGETALAMVQEFEGKEFK